jgi:hypothetical protein
VNSVVGTDEEFGAAAGQFFRRGQHEIGHALPVLFVNIAHVVGQRVGVHGDFGMMVASHHLLAFLADGAVAERRPLGAAGHDSDVFRFHHDFWCD